MNWILLPSSSVYCSPCHIRTTEEGDTIISEGISEKDVNTFKGQTDFEGRKEIGKHP